MLQLELKSIVREIPVEDLVSLLLVIKVDTHLREADGINKPKNILKVMNSLYSVMLLSCCCC